MAGNIFKKMSFLFELNSFEPEVYVFAESGRGCLAESHLLIESSKLRVHHSQGLSVDPNFSLGKSGKQGCHK